MESVINFDTLIAKLETATLLSPTVLTELENELNSDVLKVPEKKNICFIQTALFKSRLCLANHPL